MYHNIIGYYADNYKVLIYRRVSSELASLITSDLAYTYM